MSKLLFLLLSIVVVVLIGIFCIYEKTKNKDTDDLVVRIDQGLLRGSKRTSTLNNIEYYAFKGIPYAKPPIGSLRYKDPEPAEPWYGIFDATKEVTECPQVNFINVSTGNEDCLQLNVYTPQFLDKKVKRFPVMVWIHGGGFTYNSAVEHVYGAGLLIEHGVILVSLNYRIGAFGFLNILNQDAPGNAGLKDQVLALKWVKHNIYNFGGDPLDITIFGESAGSASVQYHTLSPLSQGLFHRIIMESGSVLNPWAFTEEPKVRAFQLGKLLGFNGTDDNELIQYLQKIPADELIVAQNKMINNEDAKQCLDFPFLPSIEVKGTGNNFLTEHPRTLLERGEFANVSAIIGINSKEGILSLRDAFKTKKDYGDYYGNFIPEELHLINGSEKYNELANEIKTFFFHNKPVDVNNLDEYTNICGDIAFAIGIYETINYFLNYSDSVYVYELTFEGKLGTVRNIIQSLRPDLKVPAGVSHADELDYIFPKKEIKLFNTSSPELKIVHIMTNMWTKFTKTSTPTEKINASFYWEPASKQKLNYLNINNPPKLEDTIFLPERIIFWDDIFRKYSFN